MTQTATCRFFNLDRELIGELEITLASTGEPTLYLYDDRTGRIFQRRASSPEPDGTFTYRQRPSRRITLPPQHQSCPSSRS